MKNSYFHSHIPQNTHHGMSLQKKKKKKKRKSMFFIFTNKQSSWSHFQSFPQVILMKHTITFALLQRFLLPSYQEVTLWNNLELLPKYLIFFASIISIKLRSLNYLKVNFYTAKPFSILLPQNCEHPCIQTVSQNSLSLKIETVN